MTVTVLDLNFVDKGRKKSFGDWTTVLLSDLADSKCLAFRGPEAKIQ